MAHGNRRRWERFAYPTTLQLCAAGRQVTVRLIDLSQGGMQLAATAALSVGDDVHAELATPQGGVALIGRVRWTEHDLCHGTADVRSGVAFEALGHPARERLQTLESELAGRAVSVEFSDGVQPLQAVATQTDTGVRLRLALPFLSAGTLVKVHAPLPQGMRLARIVSAQLHHAPAAHVTHVELLVQPCSGARKRRYVHYGAAERAPPADACPSQASDKLGIPKTRLHTMLRYGLPLAAAAWLIVQLSQLATGSATHRPTESTAAMRWAAKLGLVQPEHDTSSSQSPATAATAAEPALSELEREPANATSGMRRTVAGELTISAPLPTATPVPQQSSAPEAALTHARSDTRSPPTSAVSPPGHPEVASTRDTTEIFVPVTGSLAGLATKLWVKPPAVVVDIPHGKVALAQPHYDIQADGIVGLSVGSSRGMTQLRVYVASVLSQYDASAVAGGVKIRIKRDLQPLQY